MKEKEFYISPDVLIFNVKVEGVICTSGYGAPGQAGCSLGLDDPSLDFGVF